MKITKWIEDQFNKLDTWNHVAFAVLLVPLIGWLFGGLYFHAAFTVCYGYYFREHAHSNKYNPMTWGKHDYIQSGKLVIGTPIIAVVCDMLTKG